MLLVAGAPDWGWLPGYGPVLSGPCFINWSNAMAFVLLIPLDDMHCLRGQALGSCFSVGADVPIASRPPAGKGRANPATSVTSSSRRNGHATAPVLLVRQRCTRLESVRRIMTIIRKSIKQSPANRKIILILAVYLQ